MKKLTVNVVYTIELEVDERVSRDDVRWATYQSWYEWSDGRQPFCTEQAAMGVADTMTCFAGILRSTLASRICAKYPGGVQKSYRLEKLLPSFEGHFRWQVKTPEIRYQFGDGVRFIVEE